MSENSTNPTPTTTGDLDDRFGDIIDGHPEHPHSDDIETDPRFATIRDQILHQLTDEQKQRIITKFVENTIWLGLVDEWTHDVKDACLVEPACDFSGDWDGAATAPLGLPHPGDGDNPYLRRWHELAAGNDQVTH